VLSLFSLLVDIHLEERRVILVSSTENQMKMNVRMIVAVAGV
jgi:hypothetical protein